MFTVCRTTIDERCVRFYGSSRMNHIWRTLFIEIDCILLFNQIENLHSIFYCYFLLSFIFCVCDTIFCFIIFACCLNFINKKSSIPFELIANQSSRRKHIQSYQQHYLLFVKLYQNSIMILNQRRLQRQ